VPLLGAHRHAAATATRPTARDTARLVTALENSHNKSVSQVVPWFVREMPPTYFRIFGEETQRRHLRAIAALFDEELRVRGQHFHRAHRMLPCPFYRPA